MTVSPSRQERRRQDQLNRIKKLTVGQERIWTLQRIASLTEYEADQIMQTSPGDGSGNQPAWQDYQGLIDDALFLRRLAWDLEAMHDAVHGRRPSLDPQGPRP